MRPVADQIEGSEQLAVTSVARMLATVDWRFLFADELNGVIKLLKFGVCAGICVSSVFFYLPVV